MNHLDLKAALNSFFAKRPSLIKGKRADIDLYLSILETTLELKPFITTGKTLFIGLSSGKVETSEESSPHVLSKWCDRHKTEMNLIIGNWMFNPDSNKFEASEQVHFFLESWHGYLIGETEPFLITDDSLRYPTRSAS